MLELIDGRGASTPVAIPRPKPPPGMQEPADAVRAIVRDVRLRGDEAVLEHTARLDGVTLDADALRVDEDAVRKARDLVPPELVDALEVMAERLRTTCEQQVPPEWRDEKAGASVGELIRPLRRAGIYAPGGRAVYPSSVVMSAVPAQVAGVEGIAVASPPRPDGEIAEPVLAACAVMGITEVYRAGGAQAIAALAYGTDTVRPVDKVVGPGNIYVTLAKREVRGWVGVDHDAGPTEIAIVADSSAPPGIVAADLIAQAEHGPLGSYVLITWDPGVVESVDAALALELARHERPDDVESALIEGGRAVLVRDAGHALDTANAFACEHLALMFEGAGASLDRVTAAGAVFVGQGSPVSAGDYVAGTNHVLPTGGTARFSSGLGAQDFLRRIYVCELEESALRRFAPHIDALARAEGLAAHARAVQVRLEDRDAGP